jgi:uncharacterized repeat protein (TIGR01451 family)
VKTVNPKHLLSSFLIACVALVSSRHAAILPARADGGVNIYTTAVTIPTYPYADHLVDRHNDTYNIPYRRLDWGAYYASSPSASPKSYNLLVVENDYLKLTFLPELGGRLYQVIFKPTGNNELYQNPVLKPTNWGPPEQDWWLGAGGIEWGLPVEEHGYEWGTPWSYETLSASDGVTVTLRDSTTPDRLRAAVSVYLPADRAYFAIAPRIENARGVALAYKYWTNAMLAPGPDNTVSPDLRFIYPVDRVTVHSSGDPDLPADGQAMSWPVYDGRDMSRLGNWRQWLGFFERPAAHGDFIAIYDTAAREGMARVYPADRAHGAKGFAFGWGEEALPASIWTDDGSYYVEMHGGAAPTFWDSASLAAGASYAWREIWYPVAGIGGVTTANQEAALYLHQTGETVTVGVHSTAARTGSAVVVWRPGDGIPLHREIVPALGPAQPYTATFTADGDASDLALSTLDAQDRLLATTVAAPEEAAPVSQLAPLPAFVTTTAVTLSWSGVDDSAVLHYDLQVRDGPDGPWADWLTRTAQTSATFTGQDGHTYFFRVRARDAFGNVESWREDDRGDGFTSVLITPAPVLITSGKTPEDGFYPPGTSITYTVSVRNTGSLTAAAHLTDALPGAMRLLTPTLAATAGTPHAGSGLVTWQGEVASGGSVTITYAMSPTQGRGLLTPVTNAVTFDGGLHTPFTRQATAQYAHLSYLPLVAKNRQP